MTRASLLGGSWLSLQAQSLRALLQLLYLTFSFTILTWDFCIVLLLRDIAIALISTLMSTFFNNQNEFIVHLPGHLGPYLSVACVGGTGGNAFTHEFICLYLCIRFHMSFCTTSPSQEGGVDGFGLFAYILHYACLCEVVFLYQLGADTFSGLKKYQLCADTFSGLKKYQLRADTFSGLKKYQLCVAHACICGCVHVHPLLFITHEGSI